MMIPFALLLSGMASMKINADVTWDAGIIVLSIIIAVVVATVGLLLLSYVRGPLTQLITAIIVGIAVCSMYVSFSPLSWCTVLDSTMNTKYVILCLIPQALHRNVCDEGVQCLHHWGRWLQSI